MVKPTEKIVVENWQQFVVILRFFTIELCTYVFCSYLMIKQSGQSRIIVSWIQQGSLWPQYLYQSLQLRNQSTSMKLTGNMICSYIATDSSQDLNVARFYALSSYIGYIIIVTCGAFQVCILHYDIRMYMYLLNIQSDQIKLPSQLTTQELRKENKSY